ncbi:MAG: CoA-binding protein, partial [Candidatus Micrarchaeota archaeon]|nr:CoA-binding protein [Candidatus Micrarchaeota archaeon]
GGDGVLTVDAIERCGLRLAALTKGTIARLRRIFPKHVVVGNPLDLTGDADSLRYRTALQHAINEPDVDAIIVITLFQTAGLGAEVVN